MTQPVQVCQLCGEFVVVVPDGRGFPPDIAKRKLKKQCKARGCPSDPFDLTGLLRGEQDG